jgi:hypothetical protein
VCGGLDDQRGGAGVAEDPLDLLGARGLVDRHRDGAGEPDREVGEGPLVAGLRHEPDPVTRLDARGDQALGDAHDVVVELARADVLPAVAARRLNSTLGRCVGCGVGDKHRQVVTRLDIAFGGNAVLGHWSPPRGG